jgi:two-component system, LytTR family, response regulator
MKLKYIYIDSNPIDRLHFLQTLKQFTDISLMAEFSDAVHAKEYLNYNAVDFAILSSDLPVFDGFEFVDRLKDGVEIIFLTKTPLDAIKSYEKGFLDCLLKPVTKTRLKSSIDRLINKIECMKLIREKKEHIVHFKCNFKSEKLQANSIRWIEAMGDYVKVVTKNKNYMVLSTMKSFLDKLPKNQFIRIHKSYIINLKKVINYTTRNVNTDGQLLPLSRNQKRVFKENFLNFQ